MEKWSTRNTRRHVNNAGRKGWTGPSRPGGFGGNMTIVRWDPFRDFGFTAPNTWVPSVDIFQTGDHELVLKAELPDMSREDIDITVENFVLTVKGEKKLSGDVKDEQFHHVERRYGAFSRSFSLPRTVD